MCSGPCHLFIKSVEKRITKLPPKVVNRTLADPKVAGCPPNPSRTLLTTHPEKSDHDLQFNRLSEALGVKMVTPSDEVNKLTEGVSGHLEVLTESNIIQLRKNVGKQVSRFWNWLVGIDEISSS